MEAPFARFRQSAGEPPQGRKIPAGLIATLMGSVFTTMLGVGVIAPLLPVYGRSLGANGVLLGAIFSVFSASRTLFTPLTGALSDRLGRKGFMVAGLLVYCMVSVAYIKAETLPGLLAVRALHGLAASLVIPAANAYMGDLAPPEQEGIYSSFFLVSFFAGFAIGPAFGGILFDRFGMKGCFLTLGLFAFAAFVLTSLLLPNRSGRPGRPKVRIDLIGPLKSPEVFPLLVFTLVSALGRSSVVCFLPLFAQEDLHISASLLGGILTINLLLAAFLQVPSGMLADRFDRKKIVLLGTFVSSGMFVLLPLTKDFPSLLAVNVFMGIGMALVFPSSQAMAVSLGRGLGMGSVLAFLQVATGTGFAAGPLVSGAFFKWYGINSVFYLCAGTLFAAALYGAFFLRIPPAGSGATPPTERAVP